MRRAAGLLLPCIPSLTLRLKAATAQKAGLVCENPRNFVAKGIHAAFQPVIEHISQHDHATPHPLTRPTKLRMGKLSQRSVPVQHGRHHVSHSVDAEAVAPGEVASDFLSFRSQWLCVHAWDLRRNSLPAHPADPNSAYIGEVMGDLQPKIVSLTGRGGSSKGDFIGHFDGEKEVARHSWETQTSRALREFKA